MDWRSTRIHDAIDVLAIPDDILYNNIQIIIRVYSEIRMLIMLHCTVITCIFIVYLDPIHASTE